MMIGIRKLIDVKKVIDRYSETERYKKNDFFSGEILEPLDNKEAKAAPSAQDFPSAG